MEALYLIAILPPSGLSSEIHEIRKACSQSHQVYSALKPPVHITLIPPFRLNEDLQTKLVLQIEAAANFNPYTQQLKDFDSFPYIAVYIHALPHPELKRLYQNLRKKLAPFLRETKPSLKPHITIAYRDIKETYPAIMADYEHRKFRAEFPVNHFSLLKHDGQRWNVFRNFEARPDDEQLKIFH